MAVFRIEKTRDYTVMSNHHLRNAGLSLKSKGLLSMMLSLPEDWNYLRNMKRQREREALFSDLSQAELDKLCVVDRYPSDSIVFSSHGYDLHIDNELVAEAFSALPQMEQSILILHCTLDLADGEIGNLVGMSRSAVQRHRTKALQELREALSALMPKGG